MSVYIGKEGIKDFLKGGKPKKWAEDYMKREDTYPLCVNYAPPLIFLTPVGNPAKPTSKSAFSLGSISKKLLVVGVGG